MDDDLVAYVEEMIEMLNTEDEKTNEENMQLLVD
jgi:Ca2+-binding EF-hand superfamily protein